MHAWRMHHDRQKRLKSSNLVKTTQSFVRHDPNMMRHLPARTFVIVSLTLFLAACATSPLGNPQLRLFSPAKLAQMGAASYHKIKQKTPEATDPSVNAYVNCVAHALTRQIGGQWTVTVFKSRQVNAFALPGGKIGVYTGLLKVAEGPDQLAAVLGHEIGHVLAHHSNARLSAKYATSAGLQMLAAFLGGGGSSANSKQIMSLLGLGAQVGLLLPYTRGQEAEADVIGLKLMAKAGFDPRAAIALWHNMQAAGGQAPPEFLSTHPSNASRIQNLKDHMRKAMRLYRHADTHPNCG